MKNILVSAKRIVIKVGSSLLADDGKPHAKWLASLGEDIAALVKQKKQVVIVSSGAVALGRSKLGIGTRVLKLAEKQAAAACGQAELMRAWQQALGSHELAVAQLLLTLEDSDNRRRYLNARHTLETLLKSGVIPVVNENDTVATAEIRFGDNDRLAARVAQMAGADVLILLSDVDGLYTADPRKDKKAEHLDVVEKITADIEAMAGGTGSSHGSGGMVTKLAAAKIAMASGCHTVLAKGTEHHPVAALQDGARSTLFKAASNPDTAHHKWLAHALKTSGEVVVDDGAAKALASGKSLLPAGVKSVSGKFGRGDAVSVRDASGKEIARGLVAFDAEDARAILGKKSSEFPESLRGDGRDELIHRDDMVVF